MNWRLIGHDSVIVYFADAVSDASLQWALAITADVEQNPPDDLSDFIPAYTSVLFQFAPQPNVSLETRAKSLVARLQKLGPAALPDRPATEIPVRYGGADLARVAEHAKLSTRQVAELHCAPVYRVHLLGFTPGFPYMAGLDPRIHTPRLPKPRLRVESGSIGIGGAQTGIYTVDGPGGWNIIGRTAVRVYDPARAEPFLLKQGDRVRFVPA